MTTTQQRPALHDAIMYRNVPAVRSLIQAGADVNEQTDRHGSTPLYCAAARCNKTIINLLLEADADCTIPDNNGRTPLHRAVWFGLTDRVTQLLSHGADPNVLDHNGNTPLNNAFIIGSEAVCNLLINHGADPVCLLQNRVHRNREFANKLIKKARVRKNMRRLRGIVRFVMAFHRHRYDWLQPGTQAFIQAQDEFYSFTDN